MPTIGWFEILIVVAIAIVVLGPKDFPVMLKKVGSWIGTAKRYVNNIQNEVSNIDIDDEPTTGLHQHDIKKLLEILHTFVKLGNTVVVIEHNLDVIKTADYIVDMGPEGGVKGGNIIAEGKPEEVCKVPGSYTGQYLKPLLK